MGVRQGTGEQPLYPEPGGIDDEQCLTARRLPTRREVLVVPRIVPGLVAPALIRERRDDGARVRSGPVLNDRVIGGGRAHITAEPDLRRRSDGEALRSGAGRRRNDVG